MSSGTSFADLVHQAVDAAAYATGHSIVNEQDATVSPFKEEARPQSDNRDDSHSDVEPQQLQSQQGSQQQQQRQQQQQYPEQQQTQQHSDASDSRGDRTEHGGPAWLSNLFRGPGNHPDDPRANVNHPAAYDHHASSSKEDHGATSRSDDTPKVKKSKCKGEEMQGLGKIDQALGVHGPVGERLGAKYDDSLREHGDGPVLDAERETKPWGGGATIGEPILSERNQKALEEKHHKSVDINASHHQGRSEEGERGKDKDHLSPETADRAANRGPSWASRPNDEQREKIRKLKAEHASGLSSRLNSYSSTPQAANKSSDKHKPSEGRLGGLFESSGLNLFGGAGSSHSQRQKKTPLSSATEHGKGDDGRRGSVKRTHSQWAENSRRLRGAFEKPEEETSQETSAASSTAVVEEEGPKSILDVPQVQDSPMHEGDGGGSTPATPNTQKMRAITKIMLGGAQKTGSGTEGESSGDTARPNTGSRDDTNVTPSGHPQNRWAQLKKMVREKAKKEELKNQATGMDLAKELQTGILPVFLLKMAIERDEQKNRRIPVLLNHLRLRVTDSVNPLNSTHAVFRIELEYGNGLVKWVVYRELRDFINLHAHYRASALRGYLGRSIGNAEGDFGLPSFPKMSIPYLNHLQRQGRVAKADFARAQRDALENYIIELIRRTMFRAEANRLCKFFEISALSVSLAARGGHQGKQGYLRILSKSSRKNDQKSILTPARWAKAYEPKWFIVRESFIAIVNQPDTLQIYDVFLMDNDFCIERPKRLYKQTMHLAHGLTHSDEKAPVVDSSEQTGGEQNGANQGSYDQMALLTDGQFTDPEKRGDEASDATKADPGRHASSHTFYVRNAERKLKLVARNERDMEQFIVSMEKMAKRNIFSGSNRFESFAPIRLNASAQWLVDGRDYYWNLSKALLMAKDRIFIHDWWLSPELYLRRPGHPKWRLDNILKKKAEEGVKIFVIIYNEVSNNFTPTDSNYTKQRLVNLHHNIFVQRSPSHFQTGTFYWAHHEKLCVIDETIAFMGGLDLCFGRWDTPAHTLIDDAYHEVNDRGEGIDSSHPDLLGPARDGREAHIWPGQDYANERVMEWHTLSKPHEDLFPRDKFPRMPWHDVGLQLVGQPARDLCRHFTQRWNFLLRIKNHTRMMPFLVPPPDFTAEELKKFGLTGSCEVQICRSAGPWSLGTASKVEHSIQNAYLKSIQMSDHFVYIENQFFITSTVTEGTRIENQIGEALVSRIIRAHREGTPWRAIVVIPLIPGFPMPIDHPDASSVRLIVELQNRSISRGEHSIFGKLRREGINPDDYISFFSLRNWGKLRGGQLTTEQVYLHDKIMIVDDRLAIIGSANINERSQRGDRDSELACVIRDYDMLDSTMAGKPYKVGRFAHTLRVHLMREHLGVDVDELDAQGHSDCGVETVPNGNSSMYDDATDGWVDGSEISSQLMDSDQDWDPDNEQTHNGQGVETVDANGNGIAGVRRRHVGRCYKQTAAGVVTGGAIREASNRIKGTVQPNGDDAGHEAHHEERPRGSPEAADEPRGASQDERVNNVVLSGGVGMTSDGRYDSTLEGTIEEKMLAQDQAKRSDRLDVQSGSGEAMDRRRGSTSSHGHSLRFSGKDGSGAANAAHRSSVRKSASTFESYDDLASAGGSERYATLRPPSQATNRSRQASEATSISPDELKRKMSTRMSNNPWAPPVDAPEIDPDNFEDPLVDSFYRDYWLKSAVHNTQIYRKVFKCVPDDTVSTWSEYKAYGAWAERLAKSGKFSAKESREQREGQAQSVSGASVGGPAGQVDPASLVSSVQKSQEIERERQHQQQQQERQAEERSEEDGEGMPNSRSKQSISTTNGNGNGNGDAANGSGSQYGGTTNSKSGAGKAEPGAANKPPGFSTLELDQMEALLMETRGTLVMHPTRFLEAEDMSNNFLFAMDRINPLLIYD
ncbi:Phospholipase D1 [Thecaphora frezii]